MLHAPRCGYRPRAHAAWHGRRVRLEPWAPVLVRPARDGAAAGASDRGYDIQIGLATAVVLPGLALDERQFVSSLEGGRRVTDAETRRFPRTLALLAGAGVLHDDDTPAAGTPSPGAIALAGRSPLDRLIAGCCEAAGLSVHMTAQAPAHAVEVIAFVGAPDARDAERVIRNRIAHILVAYDELGAWVSHVVLAGASACSRCRDIALTRADAAWPYLAAQLSGPRNSVQMAAPPLLAAPTAAVRVAARALAWATGGDFGGGECVWPDARVTAAPLAPEAECGCGAAGAVGDEVAARRARLPT